MNHKLTSYYDWANKKFYETEQQQETEARTKIAARKATETLYQMGPDREPELLGGQYQWRPVRDQKEILGPPRSSTSEI
jgi:hypothetical protein